MEIWSSRERGLPAPLKLNIWFSQEEDETRLSSTLPYLKGSFGSLGQ